MLKNALIGTSLVLCFVVGLALRSNLEGSHGTHAAPLLVTAGMLSGGQLETVNNVSYWRPYDWCGMMWNDVLVASEDGYVLNSHGTGYSQEQIDLLYNEWRFDHADHCLHMKDVGGPWDINWGGDTQGPFVCDRNDDGIIDEEDIWLYLDHTMHGNSNYVFAPDDILHMIQRWSDFWQIEECDNDGGTDFPMCVIVAGAYDRFLQENFDVHATFSNIAVIVDDAGCGHRTVDSCDELEWAGDLPYSKGGATFLTDRNGDGIEDDFDLRLYLAESKRCALAENPPYQYTDPNIWDLIREWYRNINPDDEDCEHILVWAEIALGRVLTPNERTDLRTDMAVITDPCPGDWIDPRQPPWPIPGRGWWYDEPPTCPPDFYVPKPRGPLDWDDSGFGGSTGPVWPDDYRDDPIWYVPPPSTPIREHEEPIWWCGSGFGSAGVSDPAAPILPSEPGLLHTSPSDWLPHQAVARHFERQRRFPNHASHCDPPLMASIDPATGDKLESVVDLHVRLRGPDFRVVRTYNSSKYNVTPPLVGERWTLNLFSYLHIGQGTNPPLSIATGGYRTLTFLYDSNTQRWRAMGGSTQFIEERTNHYTLVEPGRWEIDFHKPGSDPFAADLGGLIHERRDVYGSRHRYEWDSGATPQSGYVGVLRRIYLNGTSWNDAEAIVDIVYAPRGLRHIGRIRVLRKDGDHHVMTQSVQYVYFNDTLHSAHVGSDRDLVQVVHRAKVDQSENGGALYRDRVTQYRYHTTAHRELFGDADGDGFEEYGNNHNLKMVIEPEQIEWYVQQRYASKPSRLGNITQEARALLSKDDGQRLFGQSRDELLVNLAAKVIARYESDTTTPFQNNLGRVLEQYIQAGCDCAGLGGGEARRLEYEWFGSDFFFHTAQITESIFDDSASDYVHYRSYMYDFSEVVPQSGVLDLVTRAIHDPQEDHYWVTHYEFESSGHYFLQRIRMPSATGSYAPATSAQLPSYTAGSTGLVFETSVGIDGRTTAMSVRDGTSGSPITLWELEYNITNRPDLVSEIRRYRTEDSNPSADDIETISFEYGHFDSDTSKPVAWMATTVESPLVAENGPGGTHTTYQLFNAEGEVFLTRAADGRLDRREFDPTTGEVTTIVRNESYQEIQGLGQPYSAISGFSNWGDRYAAGGSLRTTISYDLLGRTRSTTSPGGVLRVRSREMRTNDRPERRGILYYAEVDLPHVLVGGATPVTDAPVAVTWSNSANKVIRASRYELGPDSEYHLTTGDVTNYTLGAELSRAAVEHDMVGQQLRDIVWHRLDQTDAGFYETIYLYDRLGRRTTVIQPNGTWTHTTFDILDRPISVAIGTSEANLETVTELFYDHGYNGSDPESGVGDSNLTLLRQHTGESDGQGGTVVRDTNNTYDFRNRLITTENPEGPHTFHVFDNLDRMTALAIFSSLPSGTGPSDVHTNLSARGRYNEFHYDQRGLLHRVRVAINATQSAPDFIEAHRWYDVNGRIVGTWKPAEPGVKIEYDGLGRRTAEYITDRGGDALPGAAGNHADIINSNFTANLSGDRVIEQTEYRYTSTGTDRIGLVDLVTFRMRVHDAPDSLTGALDDVSLSDEKYVVSTYTGYYYDAADRLTHEVEYGTNASAFTYDSAAPSVAQGSPPAWNSGPELVTEHRYNARGLVEIVVDPQGIEYKTVYDDLDRVIASIDAYVNADVEWDDNAGRWTASGLNDDHDRVTSIVYDIGNRTILEVAHLLDGGNEAVQITEYQFGVTKGTGADDSLVNSNDMLRRIVYPDDMAGETVADRSITFEYNRLGEKRYQIDQNQTEHFYTRDLLGRVTLNRIAVGSGSDVDDTINAKEFTFDAFGRMQSARSYIDYGGGGQAVANAVRFDYTPLWQFRKFWQSHDGDVVPSGQNESPFARYSWQHKKFSEGNYSRPTRLDYPLGQAFLYAYGTSGTLNDVISRIFRIREDLGGSFRTEVQYSYIGREALAIVDLARPDVQLDYSFAHNGTKTTGVYPGFDRFGRVARHAWTDGGFTAHATDNTLPDRPPLVELAFAFDGVSNVTTSYDSRPGARQHRSHEYAYDDLHRLQEARRGQWDGSSSTFTLKNDSQKFTLDALSNFRAVATDADGDDSFIGFDDFRPYCTSDLGNPALLAHVKLVGWAHSPALLPPGVQSRVLGPQTLVPCPHAPVPSPLPPTYACPLWRF